VPEPEADLPPGPSRDPANILGRRRRRAPAARLSSWRVRWRPPTRSPPPSATGCSARWPIAIRSDGPGVGWRRLAAWSRRTRSSPLSSRPWTGRWRRSGTMTPTAARTARGESEDLSPRALW